MASYGPWATISYPNAPIPFTPLPQKYFSLQPFVQEYKIYTVLKIRDVYPRSRILIFTHPGSRILYPGSRIQKQQQYRGMKKNFCHTFLCSHKFKKIVYNVSFEVLKKKVWVNFPRIIEFFTQKIVIKLSKVWVWDPGSGIRDPEETYSGSRIQGSKSHRIPDPDP
jgi:hypothetical protein